MKKKLTLFLMILMSTLLVLSLAFCSDGEDDNKGKDTKKEQKQEEQKQEEQTDDQTEDQTSDQTEDQTEEDDFSYVDLPDPIEGTVLNKRPVKYEQGTPGGDFQDSMLSDPATFNQAQSTDNTSTTLSGMMRPGFMDINYDTRKFENAMGDPTKGSSGPGYDLIFDKDANKMEIIIYLRNDIYWSDNTRLTADEFVYYYNNIKANEEIGSNGYNSTQVEVDGEDQPIVAEKIDEFTFKYVFPIPVGDPETMVGAGIMPMHIIRPVMESEGVEGFRQLWAIDTPVTELIGYGPWLMESFSQGQNIVMKRNEKYFLRDEWDNPLPYMDKIVINIVADQNAEKLRFQAGEFSALSVRGEDFSEIVEEADAKGYTVWNGGPTTGTLFITFNQNETSDRMKGRPHLDWFRNKYFRKAMNYLIDKNDLVDKVLKGLGEPDKGCLHPASPYFNPDNMFPREYNPEKALELLEKELGMRDRDGNGILEDENGEELTFELLTNDGNQERTSVMNIIANNMKAYGINVQADTIDFNNLVQKLTSNFDWESIIIGLTGGVWPSGASNVWRSSANLHLWYPFQETPSTDWEASLDEVFAAAKNEPDFDTRYELWDEMYSIIYDQLPYILLYRKYAFLAVYNEWQNVCWDTMGAMGDSNKERLFKR